MLGSRPDRAPIARQVPTLPLSAPTVLYLFASSWAPRDESMDGIFVPGAKVHARATAANLLNVAVWSLREQGLVEVEQLRPVEKEGLVMLGGRSFSRVRPLPGESLRIDGLERLLLKEMRTRKPGKGAGARITRTLSKDDDWGLRRSLMKLDYDPWSPASSVAAACFGEAESAGLVERGSRTKPVISDPEGIEALEPRSAAIAAGRRRYREREPDLDEAVISDCYATLEWAHSPPPD